MKSYIKPVIILCVYIVIVCLGCTIYGFAAPYTQNILPCDILSFKLLRGQNAFFELLPAVCITGIIIGFAQLFGETHVGHQKRFDRKMMTHFRYTLLVCGIASVICFCAEEIGHPYFKQQLQDFTSRFENYYTYVAKARENIKDNDFAVAGFYAQSAARIYENSETQAMLSTVEKAAAEYASHSEDFDLNETTAQSETVTDSLSLVNAMNATPITLINAAEKAHKNKDFLTAHYYAQCAVELSAPGSQNNVRAKELAALAWNSLANDNSADKDAKQAEVFSEKKRGYNELMKDNVINAYYIFATLYKSYPNDHEIEQYYEIALSRLSSQMFFTDETTEMKNFEVAQEIAFTLHNENGTTQHISIAGISIVQNAAQMIQYLREFSVETYNEEGYLIEKISVPYAKMIAQDISNETEKKASFKPLIMLQSVERDNTENQIAPSIQWRRVNQITTEFSEFPNLLVLDMPYSDFNLVRQACFGADVMPLVSLFSFAPKAKQYGFSSEVYTTLLVYRLCYPFTLLSIFIICSLFSWHYRMAHGTVFKFIWLFSYPFFTALGYILADVVTYCVKVLFLALSSVLGISLLPTALGVSLLLLLFCSVMFLAARGE